MRVLKLLQGLMLILWSQVAVAGDMALILGEVGQLATLRNETSVISSDFAGPLREAGFEIVQPKNRSSGNMRLAVQRIEAAAEAGVLDRLVVVATGPFAHVEGESWALANTATGLTAQSVGGSGIAIGSLTELALAAHGRAVILIAPGREIEILGNGLAPGFGNPVLAPEVTYIIGPAEALADLVSDGLLDPVKSFSEVADQAPDDVLFRGYSSDRFGLMGKAGSPD